MKLSTTELRSGERIVRPLNALGTCGWHPHPWDAAIMRRGETAEQAFFRVNPWPTVEPDGDDEERLTAEDVRRIV